MNLTMPVNIVITGPESTGKTELAKYLADRYDGFLIPEYAREYIENLSRPYTYADVEKIAEKQIRQQELSLNQGKKIVFFDTWLVITKIWFLEVFGEHPSWVDHKLKSISIDLYLLCAPDIPWIPDRVRENGGERRDYLFSRYIMEIENLDVRYQIISGSGMSRFKRAVELINKHLEML